MSLCVVESHIPHTAEQRTVGHCREDLSGFKWLMGALVPEVMLIPVPQPVFTSQKQGVKKIIWY